MTAAQTPKPKKIGEGNKSLSVIVAEDKLVKFKAFSQGINLSMGWLLNQAIDRYLSSDSTDIFKSTLGDSDNTPKLKGVGASTAEVEELIRTSIDNYLLKTPIGNTEQNPPLLLRSDVEEMIKSSIGNLNIEELVKSSIENLNIEELVKSSIGNLSTPSIGIHEVQKLVNESIGVALEPIEAQVAQLKKPLANDKAVASNLKKSDPQSTRNRPTKEGEIQEKMSWVDFHELVELTPPNSKEKTRANADIAIERASERGITGWEFTGNKNFARK